MLWCTGGFIGAHNWTSMMLRDASLSDSYTSDRCCFWEYTDSWEHTEKTSIPFSFILNGIWSWFDSFLFQFSEANGILFGSKSKRKLSPRPYPIQCERKWNNSFISVLAKCLQTLYDGPLKPLNTTVLWWYEGFQRINWTRMMADRGLPLGQLYAYGRCTSFILSGRIVNCLHMLSQNNNTNLLFGKNLVAKQQHKFVIGGTICCRTTTRICYRGNILLQNNNTIETIETIYFHTYNNLQSLNSISIYRSYNMFMCSDKL